MKPVEFDLNKSCASIQDGCVRLSRSLIVGHLCSVVFLFVGRMIPDFPIGQIFTLQFVLLCVNAGLLGLIAATNYSLTFATMRRVHEKSGSGEDR